MSTLNALDPTPEQIKAFLAHKKDARYAKALSAMVKDQEGFGAIFGGSANAWLIGQGEGEWDAVGIFTYPDAKTMFATVSSDEYRKIHKHRRAGLAGQLLICCDNEGVF